jgi:hypothetical protein
MLLGSETPKCEYVHSEQKCVGALAVEAKRAVAGQREARTSSRAASTVVRLVIANTAGGYIYVYET